MPPALGRPPPPPQQLPAQMFTTAAQLLDLTDSKADYTYICNMQDTRALGIQGD
jgi:hypothetical protein